MILKKDYVYKATRTKNEPFFLGGFRRNYIIFSPFEDTWIDESRANWSSNVNCHFVVCFDGSIRIPGVTSVYESCVLEPLNSKDLEDVREAIDRIGCKYNRKLNKLIFYEKD